MTSQDERLIAASKELQPLMKTAAPQADYTYRVLVYCGGEGSFTQYIQESGTLGPWESRRIFPTLGLAVMTARMLGYEAFSIISEMPSYRIVVRCLNGKVEIFYA